MKIVIADPCVEDQIKSLLESHSCGILIGQKVEEDKYLVVHIAPFNEAFSKEQEDSCVKPFNLIENFNCDYAVEYSIQLSKLLLGGIQVIGFMFIGTPGEIFNKHLHAIKNISKRLKDYYVQSEYLPETSSDMLITSVCENSRNISCKVYDINEVKETLSEVDWKIGTSKLSWSRIHTTYSIDFYGPIPKSKANKTFFVQLKSCFDPVLKNIAAGQYTINNVIRRSDDKLLSKSAKDHLFCIDIFPDPFPPGMDDKVTIDHGLSLLKIQGTIYSMAFVHPKATVEFANTCIVNDICRTLLNRFELHCDSIVDEENQELVLLHEPPRRILVPLSDEIMVGDYIFPGESESYCIDNISQYFDIDVTSDDVIGYREFFIDKDEDISAYQEYSPSSKIFDKKESTKYYEIIAGLTVAFSAAVLYYFYNLE